MKNFRPIGEFELPEYELQKLSFPPVLQILDYIQREQFTEIIISTPGPMGLTGLLAAKMLNLQTSGIYHTDFPEYIRILTEDRFLESLAWTYMHWFYGQQDTVFVNSEQYRRSWIAARDRAGEAARFCRAGWTRRCSIRRGGTSGSGSGLQMEAENVERRTSNVERRTEGADDSPKFDVRRSTFDVRRFGSTSVNRSRALRRPRLERERSRHARGCLSATRASETAACSSSSSATARTPSRWPSSSRSDFHRLPRGRRTRRRPTRRRTSSFSRARPTRSATSSSKRRHPACRWSSRMSADRKSWWSMALRAWSQRRGTWRISPAPFACLATDAEKRARDGPQSA